MIGVIGWAVIFAVILLWEGAALTTRTPDWPTLSDLFRIATRPPPGRWVVFAIWLWFGWHLFVRGWLFFLRDRARGSGAAGARSKDSAAALVAPAADERFVNDEVITLVVLYAVIVGLLLYCAQQLKRHGPAAYALARRTWSREIPWRALAAEVGITVVAGYTLFVVAMAVYCGVIAPHPMAAFTRAVGESLSLTLAVVLPGFVVLTMVYGGLARLRGRLAITGRSRCP